MLLQQHATGSRAGSIRTKTRVVRIANAANTDREESTEEAVHYDDEDDVAVIINTSTGRGVVDVDDDGSQNATLI